MVTPVVEGTPGATTYEYCATWITKVGQTTASDSVLIATGPTTLNSVNKILLDVVASIPAAARYVRYYKKVGAAWNLLGIVNLTTGHSLYDVGQTPNVAVHPPSVNDSGRPDWYAPLIKTGRTAQRMELIDLIGIFHRHLQKLGDVTHRDGDIFEGCNEVFVSGTTWRFTSGTLYLGGIPLRIPEGEVTLAGTGTESVGVLVTPSIIDYEDDPVLRNTDEGIAAAAYNQPGADQLSFAVTWVVDEPLAVTIKDFVDNAPKVQTFRPERTVLDRRIAEMIFDVSGHFSVENFPFEVVAHPTDSTKLNLKVHKGKAYPNGWRVYTEGTQTVPFNRARDVKFVNNSGIDAFETPGGSVITGNPETYDLDGLNVSLTIGSGNAHVVAFTSDGMTAAQVGAAIEASVNAYPTDGELVICTAASGYLEIQAVDGKNLTVNAVVDDAYTELGLTEATTYTPLGTRIYECNDAFIRDVSDLNYRTSLVEQRTHNGSTHIDLLANENVLSILGASDTAADAHDGKWNYLESVDFVKDGGAASYVGGAEPASGATVYYAYTYNRNAIKGARTLVQCVDAEIVKGAVGGLDDIVWTGGTWTKVLDGSAVTGLSGNVKDAVQILRVNNSPGQSNTEYTAYAFLKNSDGLTHATSQVDWSSAGAPGSGAGGQPALGATYYCSFWAWRHETEGDYCSADSYDVYSEIETFATLPLRDCIDFRTLGVLPEPDESATMDYNFYLSRMDKLVLADTGDFSLIAGAPALVAPAPPDQTGVMTLAVAKIPPYTYNPTDVQVVPVAARRITQSGLNRLQERMEKMEYFAVVNGLEKEIAQQPIALDNIGIYTDALTGLGRVDTAFDKMDAHGNRVRHTAAIEPLTRTLSLPADYQAKNLSVDLVNSTHVRRNGNVLCLDYEPEVIDQQLQASIWINCAADWVYEDYVGHMQLAPFCDSFLDETQAPVINVDFDDNLTSAAADMTPEDLNSVFWGTWNSVGTATADWSTLRNDNAAGISGTISWDITQQQERQGLQITQIPGSITRDLGDRVIDMSVVPMLRTTTDTGDPFVIQVRVDGLVPNQDHAITIGGKNVDFTYDSGAEHPRGAVGTHTVQGKTTVCADNDGRLTGKFTMPAGVPNGAPLVSCFHYSLPSHSIAQATFYGKGFLTTHQGMTLGISTASIRTETVSQQQTVVVGQGQMIWGGMGDADPLAQSFVIPSEITYVSAVGLFFSAKSATMPFTVQIRSVVNGYPGPDVYATCTLEPDDIDISDDGSVETLFTFDHVLGYKAGNEFCFVTMPGTSPDYKLWAAELGAIDVISGDIIGPPMANGVLFHSPNGRTWEPWTKRDLKYKIYRSNFENDCQIVFHAISGLQAAQIATAVEEFVAPGVNVVWSYCLDGSDDWVPFHPRVNVVLEQIVEQVQLRIDVTSFGGSYQIVEQIAGVLFLLHVESADYVGRACFFNDPLALPNRIVCTVKTITDGTNGVGETSITPKYTVDDGAHWVDMQPTPGFVPVTAEQGFYVQQFETPDEATVENASNATPIVITSTSHKFQEDQLVTIVGITGNTAANGTRRIVDVSANSFSLTDPVSGADIAGNGAYTGGGTINHAEYDQVRGRVLLETDNQARAPRVRDIGFVFTRV